GVWAGGRGPAGRGGGAPASPAAEAVGGTLRWEAIVPPQGSWRLTLAASPIAGGAELVPDYLLAGSGRSESARRLARWQQGVPQVSADHAGLAATVARSAHDLGALQVFDPEFPRPPGVAAGTPWALAL